jgi:hypothetical protein
LVQSREDFSLSTDYTFVPNAPGLGSTSVEWWHES